MAKLRQVLLVDDNQFTNYINELIINKEQIAEEVAITQNGQEALQLIKVSLASDKPIPELILLDLKMPQLNGIDFIKAIIQLKLSTPPIILILTAISDPKFFAEAHTWGMDEIIRKPLSKEKLQAIMAKYFNS